MLDKSVNVLDEGMEFLDKCSPLSISVERKCKAKLKEAHLRESKSISKGWGDFIPNREEGTPH